MKFGWTAYSGRGHHARMLSCLVLAASFLSSPAGAGGIRAVDLGSDAITVQFDGSVAQASIFSLDGAKRRIALDISGATVTAGVQPGAGAVTGVRQAQYSPDTARIVLDLAEPMLVATSRFSEDGSALTLALQPAAAADFA